MTSLNEGYLTVKHLGLERVAAHQEMIAAITMGFI